jgi:N-acetylneuraminate synthase
MQYRLGTRAIGDGQPVFIIAEAGVNHNGSVDLGRRLIDAAAEAGADAVKFQTFKAENLNTRKAPKSSYHVRTTGGDAEQTWFQLLKTQEITWEMHVALMAHCRERGILFLSTPYDEQSADLLEDLGVEAFKLASTDTTNLPLIDHVGSKGSPVILSTALCDMEEVRAAVQALRSSGCAEYAVLQCTGNYPSEVADSNLRVMETFRREFGCVVGYSDHTMGFVNSIAATALGAEIFEKHFTLDRTLPGPDHPMSLEPGELEEMVQCIRDAEAALGDGVKTPLLSERENRAKLRKSLVARCEIQEGAVVTREMIAAKRPGTGLSPGRMAELIGRTAIRTIGEDEQIAEDMLR